MRSLIFIISDVSLLFILLLVSSCECSRNLSNDGSLHQDQHQYQHQHQQEEHPSSPSPSSSTSSPRLIGLNVNGRIKCLLWSNPKLPTHSTLTPLFSSPAEEENTSRRSHGSGSVQPKTADDDGERRKQRTKLSSLFLPGAVFATTDYRFRKERWYGIEQIGMIFRWNMLSPSSHYNYNRNDDGGDVDDDSYRHYRRRIFSLPTTLDITTGRSLFSPSKATHNGGVTSFIESGNLRVGWQQNEENDEVAVGGGGVDPWIQIGFDPDDTTSDDDFLGMKRRNRNCHPFHLRFFLPLIRRRFDLQWTSRWDNDTNAAAKKRGERESDAGNQWSSMNTRPNDDPWWMPQVSLDPSMGTLSSENRYRNAFVGRKDQQYWTEFKLRLRTAVPTLLSSATNNAMTISDDDDDLQTASLRLECSLITDPGEQKHQSLGSTITTARFETIVIPSFWLRSVTETARFRLIHEQNHATNKNT